MLKAGIDGWKLDFGESYVTSDPLATAEGPQAASGVLGALLRGLPRVRPLGARAPIFSRWCARTTSRTSSRAASTPRRSTRPSRGWATTGATGSASPTRSTRCSARRRRATLVVGSDLGGYLDHDDLNLLGPKIPFDSLNFARWTAVGALSPFMQLHGRDNLAPWTVPDHVDETVAVYKYWATLASRARAVLLRRSPRRPTRSAPSDPAAGTSIMRPIGAPETWAADYRWQLGDAFLVAPLLDATGKRSVALPAGARWYDWWTTTVADGGTDARPPTSRPIASGCRSGSARGRSSPSTSTTTSSVSARPTRTERAPSSRGRRRPRAPSRSTRPTAAD